MKKVRDNNPTIHLNTQESGKLVLRLGIATLFIYLATQIDFLAVVATLLLGTFFTSIIVARKALRGVRIRLSTKQLRSRCESPLSCKLLLSNQNRYLPIFHPVVSLREQDTLKIQAFQYHGIIAPKQTVELTVRPILSTRGLRRIEAFAPRSLFPFCLHQAVASSFDTSHEIVVWPQSLSLDLDSIFKDPPRVQYQKTGDNTLKSKNVDPSRIREYQAGDPKSLINWKLSAKLDKLTLIETRNQRFERYEIHLESSTRIWKTELTFERMLRQVATLVSELSRRKLIQGITIDTLHYTLNTPREFTRLFDALAVLRPSPRSEDRLTQCPSRTYRRNHLWICPAPGSTIVLSSQPATLEQVANQ